MARGNVNRVDAGYSYGLSEGAAFDPEQCTGCRFCGRGVKSLNLIKLAEISDEKGYLERHKTLTCLRKLCIRALKTFSLEFYEYFLWKKPLINSTTEKYMPNIPKIAKRSEKFRGYKSKKVFNGK